MKELPELSVEEKAKAYDESLEKAKQVYNDCICCRKCLNELFPVLAKSKDEKIRESLLEYLHTLPNHYAHSGVCAPEWIDWLEKQGEQKPVNKTKPKFHEGEWVFIEEVKEYKNGPFQIKTVDSFGYSFDEYYTIPFMYEDLLSKWSIQDAKAGDVLVNQNGEMPFIFKECKDNHIYCHCGYTNRKDIFFDRFVDIEGEELHWLNLYYEQAYPATKEQRDTLMKAMADAGYTFDFEKKELKKIEQKHAEWSEEDEKIKRSLIYLIEEIIRQPLKRREDWKGYITWLKSLKYRYTWKPSDEQMNDLKRAIDSFTFEPYYLQELYNDLKKLRGE